MLLLFHAVSVALSPIKISVDASKKLHAMNPLYLGCHSDSGFVHEVTGWSSQMLFGEMFEAPPNYSNRMTFLEIMVNSSNINKFDTFVRNS